MEPKISLVFTTAYPGPYPEPDKSSPQILILFFNISLCLGLLSGHICPGVPTKPSMQFYSPMHAT